MNDLTLFAETPRAGELGHRFLVPADLAVSEFEIAKFVEVSDRNVSIGEKFIAIGRSVPQRSGAGAREGCESIDQEDRSLYGSNRQSNDEERGEAAQWYWARGRRQSMSRPVNRWIEWAGKPIDAEVISIHVPFDGPSIIKFTVNGREIGFKVKSVDVISSSRPLVIVMAHLGITGRFLPAPVQVMVEADDAALLETSTRFVGDLQMSTHSKGVTHVSLRSTGVPRQEGTLTVRLPLIEDTLELPEWTKESP
ncbi:MAG: hypothetical protein HZA51_12270 [Planctomycetes bacterium]|nr:hypothetical protein [Planctomycetota bacterium]